MSLRRPRVRAVLSGLALTIAACGDLPTAPPRLSAAEVQRVLPVLADARLRIAVGIVNVAIQRRIQDDLGQIELALLRSDTRGAAFRSRLLYSVLIEYASQPGAVDRADAADVTAIAIAVAELSALLDLRQQLVVIQ